MSAFPESGHPDHQNLSEIRGRFRLTTGRSMQRKTPPKRGSRDIPVTSCHFFFLGTLIHPTIVPVSARNDPSALTGCASPVITAVPVAPSYFPLPPVNVMSNLNTELKVGDVRSTQISPLPSANKSDKSLNLKMRGSSPAMMLRNAPVEPNQLSVTTGSGSAAVPAP